MGSQDRYRKSRSRKRTSFCERKDQKNVTNNNNNNVTNNDGGHVCNNKNKSASASAEKLNVTPQIDSSNNAECNFIMNSGLFLSLLTLVGRCPKCVAPIKIVPPVIRENGSGSFFHG